MLIRRQSDANLQPLSTDSPGLPYDGSVSGNTVMRIRERLPKQMQIRIRKTSDDTFSIKEIVVSARSYNIYLIPEDL
jgi:hypothetical protein